jgi:Ca2+:H+ antiporter
VALIVTLMVSGGAETATLARDTVFAAVMITCNGIVGLCLLVGALRRRIATFNAEGTATALATVSTLATLTLVLPTFTTSRPGPEFSPGQLTFAAVASIALYGLFVVVQTVRHRDYFRPAAARGAVDPEGTPRRPPIARPPAASRCWSSPSWRSSGWRRSSPRRSRTPSPPSAHRSRRSAW